MPKLITISGLAGAGKSTAAALLAKHLRRHKKTAFVVNFGDFPKQAVADFFQVPVEDLFGKNQKKNKARSFLIAYAQGIKNFSGADYWAKMMIEKINSIKDVDFIIIPDLRFQEELLTLSTFNGPISMMVVRRGAILPVNEDWLILGYHKGYLEGNQLYQYFNLNKENNPMAFMQDESFDKVLINEYQATMESQIQDFINSNLLQNAKNNVFRAGQSI
jgi:hypothetical protein